MASGRLNITQKEFLDSFKSHYRTYEMIPNEKQYTKDKRLLLFYTVECGLKYWIMKNKMLKDYKELSCYARKEGFGDFGHNIKDMLKDRGLDRDYMLKDIWTSKGQRVEPKDLNQFWRYGAKTSDTDVEDMNVKVLDGIAKYLLRRL